MRALLLALFLPLLAFAQTSPEMEANAKHFAANAIASLSYDKDSFTPPSAVEIERLKIEDRLISRSWQYAVAICNVLTSYDADAANLGKLIGVASRKQIGAPQCIKAMEPLTQKQRGVTLFAAYYMDPTFNPLPVATHFGIYSAYFIERDSLLKEQPTPHP